MSKLSNLAPAAPTGPIRTAPGSATTTFEGAPAVGRDVLSELFLLAATNLVGEDTYYEAATDRDQRFRSLVYDATATDPDWLARFVPYLRNTLNMRSASIVMATESAWYRLHSGADAPAATVTTRQLVGSSISRLDECGDAIAYWRSRYGRALPKPVKRGLADAFVRLCNERAAIKYDGQRGAFRLGDVIEILHPTPKAAWQSELFKWLLDRRKHEADDGTLFKSLPTITQFRSLRGAPTERQRAKLLEDPSYLEACGLTWEYLSGLGKMDAAAWEAVIPSMGYMALLRNLRNFDEAGISDVAALSVIARLQDPEQVSRSRQLPFRFLSAYRATTSLRWAHALELALGHSTASVPELPGRTLVLVDTSASMRQPISERSTVSHLDVAGLFAGVTTVRNPGRADLVGFADGAFGLEVLRGASALRTMDQLQQLVGSVGHGTNMLGAVQATYAGHDRVVIFSDLQCAPYLGVGPQWEYAHRLYGGRSRAGQVSLQDVVPAGTQVFAVNTAGYSKTPVDSSVQGFYELGGFSDKLFTMMNMLSRGQNAGWPF